MGRFLASGLQQVRSVTELGVRAMESPTRDKKVLSRFTRKRDRGPKSLCNWHDKPQNRPW